MTSESPGSPKRTTSTLVIDAITHCSRPRIQSQRSSYPSEGRPAVITRGRGRLNRLEGHLSSRSAKPFKVKESPVIAPSAAALNRSSLERSNRLVSRDITAISWSAGLERFRRSQRRRRPELRSRELAWPLAYLVLKTHCQRYPELVLIRVLLPGVSAHELIWV